MRDRRQEEVEPGTARSPKRVNQDFCKLPGVSQDYVEARPCTLKRPQKHFFVEQAVERVGGDNRCVQLRSGLCKVLEGLEQWQP